MAPTTPRPSLQTTPRPGSRGGAPWVAAQFGLVGAAILLYFGVRGMTQGDVDEAVAHGHDLLRFESALGLDVEEHLQDAVLAHDALVTAANWVYIWGHWPVIVATLVWLARRHRDHYRLLRDAMFVSGAIGLVVFALYPVAPPRLLGIGMTDTVTELSNSYRVLQPPSLVNRYAALPSLHVGWNLLVGVTVAGVARGRLGRAFAIGGPIAMTAAVVLTANHYVVDAVAGAAVALVGLGSVVLVRRGRLGTGVGSDPLRVAWQPSGSHVAAPAAATTGTASAGERGADAARPRRPVRPRHASAHDDRGADSAGSTARPAAACARAAATGPSDALSSPADPRPAAPRRRAMPGGTA
ncbi:MAG: phosphatase PAP2 family protein [Ilumatobacter sp.]|uniref:phosphatase PAP2 family protein n=1 Tax=Ilumatobacter sp. TaxID=1967498 RepID=UPI00262BC139|nr:phosphatase PAP2 family protein [Ilumatobacter sp.]MDJ0768207.1 phosphatase PAP2 family protein [Ilumatobacter sp.]